MMKKKVILTLIGVALVSLAIAFGILQYQSYKLDTSIKTKYVGTLQTKAHNELENKLSVGISNAVSIANDGMIRKALKENNRELAINSLNSLSVNMKNSTEFQNIQV